MAGAMILVAGLELLEMQGFWGLRLRFQGFWGGLLPSLFWVTRQQYLVVSLLPVDALGGSRRIAHSGVTE